MKIIDRIRRRWTYDQQLARDPGKGLKQLPSHSSRPSNHEYLEEESTENYNLSTTNDLFEVQFFNLKLGIILRKEGEKVVIDRIQESYESEKALNEGDEIIFIKTG